MIPNANEHAENRETETRMAHAALFCGVAPAKKRKRKEKDKSQVKNTARIADLTTAGRACDTTSSATVVAAVTDVTNISGDVWTSSCGPTFGSVSVSTKRRAAR